MSNTFVTFTMWEIEGKKEEETKKIMEEVVKTIPKDRDFYDLAKEIYNKYSFIRDEWVFLPTKKLVINRFMKMEDYYNKINHTDYTDKKSFPIQPKKYTNDTGLYLIGSTHFNPYTDEHFYWLKVGSSTNNLRLRVKSYSTHNPNVWGIDSFIINDNKKEVREIEEYCHSTLAKIGKKAEDSDEWFRVSREDYLQICEEKFAYFNL